MRVLIALLLVLAGCQPLPSATLGPWRDLRVQPVLATYGTQATVPLKTRQDIAELVLVPCLRTAPGVFAPISEVTGEAAPGQTTGIVRAQQSSPSIDFDRPVTITHLRASSTYRIYAQAYDSSGALISTPDARSYVEVEVGTDDSPDLPVVQLPVKLVDTPFAAQAQVRLLASGATNRLSMLRVSTSVTVDGNEVPISQGSLSVSPAEMPRTVTLSNLQANTLYHLKTRAEDAEGHELASQTVSIPIGTDDAPPARDLSLSIPEYPLVAQIQP